MNFRYTIIFCLSLLILVGCNSNANTLPEQKEIKVPLQLEQTNYSKQANLNNEEIASHLATLASTVPLVNDATAIVAGPYAVVGIDIDETTAKQKIGTIKFSVSEALTNDPYGKTAVVIADADVMERLREMRTSMKDGEPAGIVQELAEIVSRFMPTFPTNDNQENNSPPPATDNKMK